MTKSPSLDVSALVEAPAAVVMNAFFDGDALSAWWRVARSVTTARALGPYALEWTPSEFRDDVLGRLGGVFRGVVIECEPPERFFVADAYWLPPDGEPIGPMALRVTLHTEGARSTRVRVTQTGFEESPRWRRYYEVIGLGWERALASLKSLLET